LVNLTQLPEPPNFRQSAALLATCDAVVAPDSALCHLAGALNLPTVALYGPFPWALRTAYALRTVALSGHGPCAPCFHHERAGEVWPEGKPCAKSGRCEVLATIEPERILAKLEKML
jgi:heptosyltransferase-2